ncbi:hypothetical protein M0J18_RS05640 [Morganella morganii]|nr:hypothetical protein [Morganella morganii]
MTIKIEVTTDLILSLYARLNSLFPWQKRWYEQRFQRARDLHKGRQIGADYYFALEAVLDACLTGRNKIFIEPAPADPEDTFISGAINYAALFLGCEVKPYTQTIKLSNGASIRFIPETNRCWAGFYADVYLSEWAYFTDPWVGINAAYGVAANEQWRLTFYSSIDEHAPGKDIHFAGNSWYHDSVPFLPHECTEAHCAKVNRMPGFYTESHFRQVVLCQLP